MSSRFNGFEINSKIKRLPHGETKANAYLEAIKLADNADDEDWRLSFRFDYASEVYFHDDPSRCIPAAAEFSSVFESASYETQKDEVMIEAYLMITQMGIDVMSHLPQIPLAQYDAALEHFNMLTKRFDTGRHSYFMQMYTRWEYADSHRASEYIERALQTPMQSFDGCKACEYASADTAYIRLGDTERAKQYAAPLESFKIHPCESSFQTIWAAYLEYALNKGDFETAAPLAEKLYKKGNRSKTDLCFLGPVLRCYGTTNQDKAVSLFSKRLEWTIGMSDKKLVYDFLKGAWVCFRNLAQKRENIKMNLPREFSFWREDGIYNTKELSEQLYGKILSIAQKFDRRNNSTWFADDLAKA